MSEAFSEEALPQRLVQIEKNLRAEALNYRKAALDDLAQLPADIAVPILQKLAQENEFILRRLAVMGLGNQNSPFQQQALDVLTTCAQSPDWRIRWRTAIALHGSTDPQAQQLIAKLQQDDHYRVVAAALDVAAS